MGVRARPALFQSQLDCDCYVIAMQRRGRVWIAVIMLLGGCMGQKDAVSLSPFSFEQLPGFADDAHAEALALFLQSCALRVPVASQGFASFAVSPAAWYAACREAAQVPPGDNPAAAQFFRTHFTPYRVTGAEAHFTGYYVPVLRASRVKEGAYRYPAYAMPPELKNGTATKPYTDRAAIDGGALAGRGLELLWCDDPVMLFFAHVQGSATVELPDGSHVRLAFAGKNGQPYHAIGKTLIKRGELAKENVSLQTIRDWLYAHPDRAAEVMQTNPSYIFFSLDESAGSVRGSHGSALAPGRSLAVDTRYIPLGLPLYISTTAADGMPLQRMMLAADTGSAIKGAARGDIFFGYGAEAEVQAGAMNAGGEMYLLLPKGDER